MRCLSIPLVSIVITVNQFIASTLKMSSNSARTADQKTNGSASSLSIVHHVGSSISVFRGDRFVSVEIIKYDPIRDEHVLKFDKDGLEETVSLQKERLQLKGQPVLCSSAVNKASFVGRKLAITTSRSQRRKTKNIRNAEIILYDDESGQHEVRFHDNGQKEKILLEEVNFKWRDTIVQNPASENLNYSIGEDEMHCQEIAKIDSTANLDVKEVAYLTTSNPATKERKIVHNGETRDDENNFQSKQTSQKISSPDHKDPQSHNIPQHNLMKYRILAQPQKEEEKIDMHMSDCENEFNCLDGNISNSVGAGKNNRGKSGKKRRRAETVQAKKPASDKGQICLTDRATKSKKRKSAFIIKKEETLALIPEEVKTQYLQIGFADWLGSYEPVLFCGPYEVSPGPVRDSWFLAFEDFKLGKSLEAPRIVYWFSAERLEDAFSILTEDDWISYDEGICKGLKDIPSKIKKKIVAGQELCPEEESTTRAWNAMKDALKKSLNERVPFLKVGEDYEAEDCSNQNSISDDQLEAESDESTRNDCRLHTDISMVQSQEENNEEYISQVETITNILPMLKRGDLSNIIERNNPLVEEKKIVSPRGESIGAISTSHSPTNLSDYIECKTVRDGVNTKNSEENQIHWEERFAVRSATSSPKYIDIESNHDGNCQTDIKSPQSKVPQSPTNSVKADDKGPRTEKEPSEKAKKNKIMKEVRKGSLVKSSKAVESGKKSKERASQHLQTTDYIKPDSNNRKMSSEADRKGAMSHSTRLNDKNEKDEKSENVSNKVVANSDEKNIKSSPSRTCPGLMSSKDQEEPDLSKLKPGDRTALKFDDEIYFGCFEELCIRAKNNKKWSCIAAFDDESRYELDYDGMVEAVLLYEEIKKKELENPSRELQLKKFQDTYVREKNKILSKIPREVQAQFLQLGFADWLGIYQPVLFCGPFDVSPGQVRDNWMDAFRQCKKNEIPRIIFWFSAEKMEDSFSVLTSEDWISYEEGVEKGLATISAKIKRKIESKKDISPSEKLTVKAYEGMEEALYKEPEFRLPFKKLKEDYEYVLGLGGDRLLIEVKAELSQNGRLLSII